jgi:hypothetical protein
VSHPAGEWVAQQARNLVLSLEEGLGRFLVVLRDRDAKGEFNWSSQHLDGEELRWEQGSVEQLIVRVVRRCVCRAVRWWDDASTELNPVELLNGDVKRHVAQANPARPGDLAAEARAHLRRRQNQPEAVKALFGKPEVRYAAA